MSGAIMVGILAGAGTWLVVQRTLVRIVIGFVLLGHAANVLLLAAGGLGRRGVPIIGTGGGPAADPLPQAFVLTAIVISFGITVLLLALARRGRDLLGSDDTEDEHADDRPGGPS